MKKIFLLTISIAIFSLFQTASIRRYHPKSSHTTIARPKFLPRLNTRTTKRSQKSNQLFNSKAMQIPLWTNSYINNHV